jgi:hypothetical protein
MSSDDDGADNGADGGTMPIDWPQHRMWTVAEDRRSARLQLPPLAVAGLPEPLNVFMDFDAETIDEMLGRLTEARAHMLPPSERH